MIEHKHIKIRILRNIISCILYIIALSVVLVLISIFEAVISSKLRGHSLPLNDPGYWINQFQNNIHSSIFYITCQFIAASLIIRNLSLKKLFVLTCVFVLIGHWLENFLSGNRLLFFSYLFTIMLPYVAPILILAVISGIRKNPISDIEGEMEISKFEADIPEQTVNNIKNKNIRYWYVLDILLIGFVLYWGNLLDPFGIVSYISGLYNRYSLLASGFIYAMLIVPACLCLLVLIFRLFFVWPKHISNKRKLRSFQIVILICLFAFLALPFLPIIPAPKRMYIAGFEGYVKKNADTDEIRNWLNSLTREDFIEYAGKERIEWREKLEWPETILKLHPGSATLSWDKNYKPKVSLSWGSGVVGPWGFVVLNENISNPEFGLSTRSEYRSKLQNGVYVLCRSN